VQALWQTLPSEGRDNPHVVAEYLIKTGRLSRFQANKILKGVVAGLILGPYQVLAPIGKGGMGTVYLARDQRNRQLVALKVLPPRRARRDPRLMSRFRREMDLCRRVKHPHLAAALEVGQISEVAFIAMEFVPGVSLYRLVSTKGALPPARAARLLAEVASAVQHIQEQGLIHRDLKPANVMVTPNDRAKLLDLGLALVQGETGGPREVVGGAGYIVGTWDYISPEQIADSCRVDVRSDVYSLGCTLYFALTGQPPFPGGKGRDKMHRQLREEPVPIRWVNPAIPDALGELVHQMMAKDPALRPKTAAEVERELRRLAGPETTLPMDVPSDAGYARAVADLEMADPIADDTDQELLEIPEPASQGISGLWLVVGVLFGLMLLIAAYVLMH